MKISTRTKTLVALISILTILFVNLIISFQDYNLQHISLTNFLFLQGYQEHESSEIVITARVYREYEKSSEEHLLLINTTDRDQSKIKTINRYSISYKAYNFQ